MLKAAVEKQSRQMAALLLVVVVFISAGCRSVIPQSGEERSAQWVGGDQFIELRMRYDERASMHPLDGSTRKSDYRSSLTELSLVDNEVRRGQTLADFRGWALPESIFRCGTGLAFAGGGHDQFGVPPTILYLATAGQLRTMFTAEDLAIESAVPSPDRRWLLIRFQAQAGSTRLWLFSLDCAAANVQRVARWEGAFGSGPLWAQNSARFYLESGDRQLSGDLSGAALQLRSAQTMRYLPSTSDFGPVDNSGRTLWFDPEREQYTVGQDTQWQPYNTAAPLD